MQEIQRREARLETQHSDHQFEESGVNFTGDEAPSSKPDGRRAPHPEQPRTKKEEAFPRLRSPEQATDAAATRNRFWLWAKKRTRQLPTWTCWAQRIQILIRGQSVPSWKNRTTSPETEDADTRFPHGGDAGQDPDRHTPSATASARLNPT